MQASRDGIFNLYMPSADTFQGRAAHLLYRGLGKALLLHRLNSIYMEIPENSRAKHFMDEALDGLDVTYETTGTELSDIPREGPLVVVANHPFGGIEGLLLGSIMLGQRGDTKIMANYLLGKIPELKDVLLCVDPFGNKGSEARNLRPLREAISWLSRGHALVVFPAGAVSRYSIAERRAVDPRWNEGVARIIRRTGASVIPVFFEGANSPLFHLAGMVNSRLRTALLPFELANKRNSCFRIRIGKVLPFRKLGTFDRDQDLMDYVRMRTDALRYRCVGETNKGETMPATNMSKYGEQVICGGPQTEILASEVERLPPEQVLVSHGDYIVAHSRAHQTPNLLFEIGRLREITFRAAGEGTGKSIDLDRFDLYYDHLFVWDRRQQHVVGAYRLGRVDAIRKRFGKNGLYTNKLFNLSDAFLEHVSNGMELGRSFVRLEYQRLYAPLLLLWKGIGRFVAARPDHRILFGPVSISETYSEASRKLMVLYLTVNHYAHDLARLIKPRMPVRGKGRGTTGLESIVRAPGDIEDLSLVVSDIESDNKGVPVLLKQYVKMGGKLMGFNVDRCFGNTLDGLIMVDLARCDRKVLDRYMGEEGADRFLAYHQPRPQHLAS